MTDFAYAAARAATVPWPAPSLDATFRPARALVGWMESEQASQALALGHDSGVTPAMIARAARARRSVTTRDTEFLARSAVDEAVEGIGEHLATFRPLVQDLLGDGWRFATFDLTRLVALQTVTFTDHYAEKTYDLSQDDADRIAHITLPLPDERQPLVQPDPNGHVWLVSSNDPHLQVAEAFQDPDAGVLGFRLGRPTSILKVALIGGRAVCLDGHHRVYQLLRRGIERAPGMVRGFDSLKDVPLPPGLLSEEIVCGDHPPRINDLLDDEVSAPVLASATRKYLLIEARELLLPI